MNLNLFDAEETHSWREELCPDAVVLRGFALAGEVDILSALEQVFSVAPLRHLVTPGGFRMSVAMSNCGTYGWVSDRTGYRYDTVDPDSGKPWPSMPALFSTLAADAATQAGFSDFKPDACLINRYAAGTRLSLHQDKDEQDFSQPIVSVSLGVPAIFLFGGTQRTDKTMRVKLTHGDVVVWGGAARLRYHGILPVKTESHPLTGEYRINLTLRKAI